MAMDDRDDNPAPFPERDLAKKPYRAPVLHVYGNLRAITQAVGSAGAMDGGTMAGMMMTR
jgi:hypothetical protein